MNATRALAVQVRARSERKRGMTTGEGPGLPMPPCYHVQDQNSEE